MIKIKQIKQYRKKYVTFSSIDVLLLLVQIPHFYLLWAGLKFHHGHQGHCLLFWGLASIPLDHCQPSRNSLPLVDLGVFLLLCPVAWMPPKVNFNPNTQKFDKILQRLSPKHVARGVAQLTYPYSHAKAGLSKQLPWRAAGDPHLTPGRSWVQASAPVDALHTFFSTLPSFLLLEFFLHLPHHTHESVKVKYIPLYKPL